MSITIKPTKHLVRVYELLLRTYGEPKNEPDYDPLGALVGTILSQHFLRGKMYVMRQP